VRSHPLPAQLHPTAQYQGFYPLDEWITKAKEAKTEADFEGALLSIHDFLSMPEKIELVGANQLKNLFQLFSHHIFHEIEDPPAAIVYSDVPATYSPPPKHLIDCVHSDLTALIKGVRLRNIEPFINKSFIERFCLMLRVPSPEEQKSMVSVINAIMVHIHSQIHNLFVSMSELISGYREGIFNYFCVAPALQFFISFYQGQDERDPRSQNLFKTYIFPLFGSPFLEQFFPHLSELSVRFHGNNPSLAVWCQYYLLSRWPKTSSVKQSLFLKHCQLLSTSMKSNISEKLAERVFRRVARCIESDNFRVSVAGLEMVKDRQVLHAYGAVRATVYQILLPAVKKSQRHWSGDVKQLAVDVANLLYMTDAEVAQEVVTSADIRESQAAASRNGWVVVATAARMVEPSVSPGVVERQVLSFLFKNQDSGFSI
jgi:hypothetical protein